MSAEGRGFENGDRYSFSAKRFLNERECDMHTAHSQP